MGQDIMEEEKEKEIGNGYAERRKEWERKIEDVMVEIIQEKVDGLAIFVNPSFIGKAYEVVIKDLEIAIKSAKKTNKFILKPSMEYPGKKRKKKEK